MLDEAVGKAVAPRARANILKAIGEYLISLGTMDNAALRQTMLAQNEAALSDVERCNVIDLMFAQFVQAWRADPQEDADLVLQKFTIEFISIALEVAPIALRRRLIGGIAALTPTDFRNGLIALRSRIKDQYGGQGDEHGKSRSTWLRRSGHAKWVLIADVLDVMWPPSNGPLGKDSRRFAMADSILTTSGDPQQPGHYLVEQSNLTPAYGPNAARNAAMHRLRKEGWTYGAIGRFFGVSAFSARKGERRGGPLPPSLKIRR